MNPEIQPYIKAFHTSEKNVNGNCSIKYIDDIIYLTITPARGNGRVVNLDNVIREIKFHGYNPNNKISLIKEIIEIVNNQNIQIENIPLQLEKNDILQKLLENKEIAIEVSPDKMQAFLIINTKEPIKININDLLALLKKNGIIYGVDIDLLSKIVSIISEKEVNDKILIAKGRRFIEGKSASIKLKPGFERLSEENELRSSILSENTIVLIKEPPIEHIPIKLVDGEEKLPDIVPKINDIIIETGKGIVENKREDGLIEYKTNTRGIVVFKDNKKLSVIPALGGIYTLVVSADGTKLLFDAISSKGSSAGIKFEQIKNSLIKMGVKEDFINYSLLIENIEKINRGEITTIIGLVIAQGIKPIHGKNGKIEYHESLKNYRKIHIREDGSIDHKLSSVIYSVNAGEVIAKIIPPDSDKKDGMDIFGNIIKAHSGKYPNIQCGFGCKFSEDKLSIISTINGRIRVIGNTINVEPTLLIPGDVDYSTGSINFKGTVIINGSVLDGFNIYSSGDIIVKNSVGVSRIICEGNLTINGGINGKNKAEIFVAGDLNVLYISQARVETRGNIYIQKSAVLSRIFSAKRIIFSPLFHNSGAVSCQLMALELIDLGRIGTERSAAETSIILGIDYNLLRTNKRIQKRLMDLQNKIIKINKAKIEIENNSDELIKLNNELNKNIMEFDNLLLFQKEILAKMENNFECMLICRKAIYPEAIIIIEKIKKHIKEPQQASIFKKDAINKKIIHQKYNPKEKYYK